MPIVRAKIGYTKLKMITITLPADMVNYATLYGLSKGESRAKVIRAPILTWYNDKMGEISEERLIENIVYQLDRIWQNKKSKYKDFDEYLDQLEYELGRRKSPIEPGIIKLIILKLDEKNRQG